MQLFSNNARSKLASSVAGFPFPDTSITVETGDGALFQSPTGGDYELITLIDPATGAYEILRCTARSGDVLTVSRGQEGTVGLSWPAGTVVFAAITAGTIDTFIKTSGGEMSGNLGIVSGSPISPGLYFNDESNTGIYLSETGTLSITTVGIERFRFAGLENFSYSDLVITKNSPILTLNKVTGNPSQLKFTSSESIRWVLGTNNTPETGSNVGSDFQITRYGDSGTPINVSLKIDRATGAIQFTGGSMTMDGYTVWHANNDGATSGLDADLLDGLEGSSYATLTDDEIIGGEWTFQDNIILKGNNKRYTTSPDSDVATGISGILHSNAVGTALWGVGHTPNTGTWGVFDYVNTRWALQIAATTGADDLTYLGNKVFHAGNDGSGSGLDADLLDGLDSTAFGILASSNIWEDTQVFQTGTSQAATFTTSSAGPWHFRITRSDLGQSTGVTYDATLGGVYFEHTPSVAGQKIWHAGNDGSGSGLDADTVDGIEGATIYHTGNVGPGSGLDADTVDGIQGTDIAQLSAINTFGDLNIFEGIGNANPANIAFGSIRIRRTNLADVFGISLLNEDGTNNRFVSWFFDSTNKIAGFDIGYTLSGTGEVDYVWRYANAELMRLTYEGDLTVTGELIISETADFIRFVNNGTQANGIKFADASDGLASYIGGAYSSGHMVIASNAQAITGADSWTQGDSAQASALLEIGYNGVLNFYTAAAATGDGNFASFWGSAKKIYHDGRVTITDTVPVDTTGTEDGHVWLVY